MKIGQKATAPTANRHEQPPPRPGENAEAFENDEGDCREEPCHEEHGEDYGCFTFFHWGGVV